MKSPESLANDEPGFEPVFIVGMGRSGTTLAAVLLDRHSRLAVPPETQFFSQFLRDEWPRVEGGGRRQMVDAALASRRIADLELDRDAVLDRFSGLTPTPEGLFQALLEAYAEARGKPRSGEKSPSHIRFVPELLQAFPRSRVVIILRDGRDVVRSLQRAQWAGGGRLRLLTRSLTWVELAQMVVKWSELVSPEQLTTVRFEDLALDPRRTLERLCRFIGEEYEPRQLDPSVGTGAVPDWEEHWKGKAREVIDPSRAFAWRGSPDRLGTWLMTALMRPVLKRFDYPETDLEDCPLLLRGALFSLAALLRGLYQPLIIRITRAPVWLQRRSRTS